MGFVVNFTRQLGERRKQSVASVAEPQSKSDRVPFFDVFVCFQLFKVIFFKSFVPKFLIEISYTCRFLGYISLKLYESILSANALHAKLLQNLIQ